MQITQPTSRPLSRYRGKARATKPVRGQKANVLSRLRQRLGDRLRGQTSRDVLVEHGLTLGENVFLGHRVYIDPRHCWLLEIGDRAVISPNTVILAHDASTRRQLGFSRLARVRIGREVYIGCAALILPGVSIGDG